jgi:nucleoside-diphosphate-sugar epimerase
MRVLIAGCGYVGSALARRLVDSGHTVYGLRRNVAALPAGVLGVAADLSDPATLVGLPAVDGLVYAAAADGRTRESYETAYVRGLENVLLALDGSALRRGVLTSSTAVYSQEDGSTVDEDSPTEPTGFSGELLLESERLFRERLGARGVVLRLAGIYGPSRTRLVRTVADGSTAAPEPRFTNRIHLADCAGALAHLLNLEAPAPVYLGVDHDPAELGDVMAFIAARIGVPWPPLTAPAPGPSHEPARVTRRAEGNNKRCSNARLVGSGYRFEVPTFREGYPAICAEYLAERAATRRGDS